MIALHHQLGIEYPSALHLLQPTDQYAFKDNAALAAQSIGKTAALCEANSEFQQTIKFCQQCIASQNGSNAYANTVEPQFKQFLDYCNNLSPSELSSLQSQTQKQSSIAAQQSSLSAEIATINSTSGTIAPSVKSLLAEQTSASALLASLNDQLLSVTRTLPRTTGNILSSQLITTVNFTQTAYITAAPAPYTPRKPHTQVVRTIAPAVVIPIAASAAIITVALLCILRRRRRRREALMASQDPSRSSGCAKPELHADDVRPELDQTTVARPPEARRLLHPPLPGTAELPALEPVAHEMD